MDNFKARFDKELFVQICGPGNAVIFLIDQESNFRMVFFQYNYTTLVKMLLGSLEKVNRVFVWQVGKNPLDPYAIVLFFELEILKASTVEMSDIFLFKYLFGFVDIFLALIDDVNLNKDKMILFWRPDIRVTWRFFRYRLHNQWQSFFEGWVFVQRFWEGFSVSS